jgi:hypothetical protein
MTKSTRRQTQCATCGNKYNAKGDHTSCPYCSGAKASPGTSRKPNKLGFVNYGGESKSGKSEFGRKLLAEFEKRKGKP